MHSSYQMFALGQIGPALPVAAVVSIVYYRVPRPQTLARRALASSHGIFLLLAADYAIAISKWSNVLVFYTIPFWFLLVLFLASATYALFQYRGWIAVHSLQLLLLLSAFWIWFVGTMTITRDWI